MKKIILKLTGLRFIASLVGLLYSILQIRYFGASAEVDAFFVAMSAVYMITSLVQGGQLAEVFLPEYLAQKEKHGPQSAHKLLSVVLNRMCVFVIIVLIILYFFAPVVIGIIGPGLDPQYRDLSANIFAYSLVLILFTLISSFVSTTLNAEHIYGRTELTALINGVASVIILMVFHRTWGIYSLVIALLAGKIIEFGIGLTFLKRIGYKHRAIWSLDNYHLLDFFKVMLTTSGYVGATQLYSVTMTAAASFLPVGSLSIFNYVKQLSTKASGIIMGPITTVFFSKFSSAVAQGKADLVNHLKKPISYTFILTFLIFCAILVTGKELLHVLWSKQSLTEPEFETAYLMLWLNFFGFIFLSIAALFRKAAVSLGRAKLLYNGWTITQLLSALYAFLAIYWWGILGLASIILVNMVLLTLITFVVTQKSGLETRPMILHLISRRKFIFFTVFMLANCILSVLIPWLSNYSTWVLLISKSIFVGVVSLVAVLLIYKKEMVNLMLTFKK